MVSYSYLDLRLGSGSVRIKLGPGLVLRRGLWLEWYIGLGCGSVYQYNNSGEVRERAHRPPAIDDDLHDYSSVGDIFLVMTG